MNRVLLAAICAPLVFGAVAVHAYNGEQGGGGYERGERHGSIRDRMREAEERIGRGVDRGSIGRREAHRLYGELHGIRERMERMRYDDRGMSRDEQRARLDRDLDLDRLDEHIRLAKHDEERRYDEHRRY
jgi:hypothetical protein